VDKETQRLEWVQRNQRRGRKAQRLGEIAKGLVEDPKFSGPAWRRRLLAVLVEQMGAHLLNHICVSWLRNGVLQLEVSEPAVLYHLRLQWERRIIEVLQAELPEVGVHTIRFSLRGSQH
jgi:hypothetical protein